MKYLNMENMQLWMETGACGVPGLHAQSHVALEASLPGPDCVTNPSLCSEDRTAEETTSRPNPVTSDHVVSLES